MLGEVPVLSGAARLLGLLAVVAAVLAYVRLQAWALAMKDREGRWKWASNLRDVLNLVALATLLGAFVLAGAPFAAALLFAGTIGLVLEVARYADGDPVRRLRRATVVGLACALPVAAFLPGAVALANRVADVLF